MTDRLALPPRYRRTVEALLREHVPECEVRAFGSCAAWTTKDYSDLAIVGAGPLEWRTLGRLREAFEESSLPMRVDVLDWHAIPESFRRVIEQGYVVVQEAGGEQTTAGEWQEASLGEVIELKRGYDLPQRKRIPGSVPLVSSSGVTYYHTEAKVRGPGVVTGRYGTLGEVFFVPSDFWPLNTTLYVRDFKGNDLRFISYFLRGLDFSAYSDKAAVPGLNRNHLHQATVRYPPSVAEQRAIAHVLGTLDDKIELNRRMNEMLEAMARALFKDWFVDFGPIRAKMAGREPYLPPDVWSLFPDRLAPSELGDIPAGWEVKALEGLVEVVKGRSYRSTELGASDVALVTLKSIQRGGGYSRGGLKPYTGDYQPNQVVKTGDLIVAQTDVTHTSEVIVAHSSRQRFAGLPGVSCINRIYSWQVISPLSEDWFGLPVLGHVSRAHDFHRLHELAGVNRHNRCSTCNQLALQWLSTRFALPPEAVIPGVHATDFVPLADLHTDGNVSECHALSPPSGMRCCRRWCRGSCG